MTRLELGLRVGDCLTCFDGYLSTGEVGMRHDGSPMICPNCDGSGRDYLNAGLSEPVLPETI